MYLTQQCGRGCSANSFVITEYSSHYYLYKLLDLKERDWFKNYEIFKEEMGLRQFVRFEKGLKFAHVLSVAIQATSSSFCTPATN